MIKPKIYLTGSITDITYEQATNWYNIIHCLLPEFELLKPMRNKACLKEQTITRELVASFAEHPFIAGKSIVARDKSDVRRCDAIIANLTLTDKESVGTACEITLAHEYHKPVVLIKNKDAILHPFITEACDWITHDYIEACIIIRSIFNYPIQPSSQCGKWLQNT